MSDENDKMVEVEKSSLASNAHMMDKYSRQIGAYGMEAMSKLIQLKVLIVGMKGLGVEVAKNLILAGPGTVCILDNEKVQAKDLGSNFFLEEKDIDTKRGPAVISKLQALNNLVMVKSEECEVDEEFIAGYDVMVVTGCSMDKNILWNQWARANNTAFISGDIHGCVASAFSDFGTNFVVKDETGEPKVTRVITHISNDEKGEIRLMSADDGGRGHGIEDSDHEGWVELSAVEGMECLENNAKSINEMGPFRIKPCYKEISSTDKDGKVNTRKAYDAFTLSIGDLSNYSSYTSGGVLTQVKVPVVKKYRSFEACLACPDPENPFMICFTDGVKFGRDLQLHLAKIAVWIFLQDHGRLPLPNNEEDANLCVEIAKSHNEKMKAKRDEMEIEKPTDSEEEEVNQNNTLPIVLEEVDEKIIKQYALYAACDFQPMCAFLGGVIAQEIVKHTGTYSPINQMIYIDCFEVLPEEKPQDTDALNTRYDDMIAMFGVSFLERLHNARTFMVGCGALGCEYLKNFAMLGFATGQNGQIIVTDNDRIEVSNLSRQFLFREHNVGQPKSKAAAEAVMLMNNAIRVDSREILVNIESENTFNDKFWENLDFITNALDNVKARRYVDGKCVFYEKALLEAGTLGTKCNTQVIVPHITASYSDQKDADEDADNIPMCTLRNFPSLIEHCIEWARSQFNDCFVDESANASKYLKDPNAFMFPFLKLLEESNSGKARNDMAKALTELEGLHTYLTKLSKGVTFEMCLEEAYLLFHDRFRDRILNLTHENPEDAVTREGAPFWSGHKRFPMASAFDAENEMHLSFIISTANILACNYGIVPPPEKELLNMGHQNRDPAYIKSILSTFKAPEWIYKKNSDDEEEGEEGKNEEVPGGSGGSNSNTGEQKVIEEGSSSGNGGDEGSTMDIDSIMEGEGFDSMKDRLEKMNGELNVLAGKLVTYPEAADFEKDQDLNFHIDFITATSNLRASNYKIKMADRHKCKMIAGKIIPAIATATASVCGLGMVEMLKIIQKKPLEAYRDSSNNLGISTYLFSEPGEPKKKEAGFDEVMQADYKVFPEKGFTKWDKIVVKCGDVTTQEFLDAFKTITKLNVYSLFHDVAYLDGPCKSWFLYNEGEISPNKKEAQDKHLNTNLKEWIKECYNAAPDLIPPHRQYIELQVQAYDDDYVDYATPTVIYRWA